MAQITRKIIGEVVIEEKPFKNIDDWKEKIHASLQKTISETISEILAGGIGLSASDIHLEPKEKNILMRARIDGILHDVVFFEKTYYKEINSRIKILSNLKINITDRPQDGRFTIKTGKRDVETRVSVLPSEWGESIVLRLLDPKSLKNLEELGMRDDILNLVEREIKKPYGMILVVGPTGSGKTTTLYAILNRLKKPEIKIITIEDPIEYHLEGILQTQVDVKKGYDFAHGLESIMRQDPDVILVGEIRDSQTTNIALQAALTGHLVLSTLHTEDAAGCVARLINLGAKPFHIAPAVDLIIAQRLVRKVCKNCVEFKKIEKDVLEKIKRALKGILPLVKIPPEKDWQLPVAKGCEICNFSGYKGLTGVFETFVVDPEIEEFILTSPPISALREMAIKKGMITIIQDGIIKVLEKITTIQEVERVIGLI